MCNKRCTHDGRPIAAILALTAIACIAALSTSACGGKLAPSEGDDDASPVVDPLEGCGPLDAGLECGLDPCGNAIAPICRPTLWVCPPIPPSCPMDASPGDGGGHPAGFACGNGSCPPNTFCQDPFGASPGACIPFPQECRRTPNTPSATCACLERRAAQDKVCRPTRFLCPYPTSNLTALHVGCVAD